MQRTTILLPPPLKLEAQRVAREMGISFGDLVRQALSATLRRTRLDATHHRDTDARDPLFADATAWNGEAPEDLARDHDRYLYGNDA